MGPAGSVGSSWGRPQPGFRPSTVLVLGRSLAPRCFDASAQQGADAFRWWWIRTPTRGRENLEVMTSPRVQANEASLLHRKLANLHQIGFTRPPKSTQPGGFYRNQTPIPPVAPCVSQLRIRLNDL